MKMGLFRLMVSASTALILVTILFLFFASSSIGSAYLLLTGNIGSDLPLLTIEFSIPMLKAFNADPFSTVSTPLWVWVVWAIMLAGPVIVMVWTIRAQRPEQAVARWSAGISLFLAFAFLVSAVTFVGLILPFSPL